MSMSISIHSWLKKFRPCQLFLNQRLFPPTQVNSAQPSLCVYRHWLLGVKTYLLLDDTYFDNEVGEDCISDEVVRAQVNCTDQQQLKQHQRHLIAIQHQRVKHVLLV